MAASVVPQKSCLRHAYREAVVEDALEVLGIVVLLRSCLISEERRRRHLHRVADDDRILASRDRTYRLACRKLRSLVENDKIKQRFRRRCDELRRRYRAHENAWRKLQYDVLCVAEQRSDGDASAAALYRTLQFAERRRGIRFDIEVRYPLCDAQDDLFLGYVTELVTYILKFAYALVEYLAAELFQCIVAVDDAADHEL